MPVETRHVVLLTKDAYTRLKESAARLPVEPQKSFDKPTVENPPAPAVGAEQLDRLPPRPSDQVPARFRAYAESLLEALESSGEFEWNGDSITVKGVCQNITMTDFLRAVCIPFTKCSVPDDCLQLMERLKIKPRNHILINKEPTQWHVYFKF